MGEQLSADGFVDHGRYSLILRPTGQEWYNAVLDETGTWLAEKGIHADLSRDMRLTDGQRRIRGTHHRNSQAQSFRLTIDEDTPNGQFVTTVLAIDDPYDPWVMVRVVNDRRLIVPSPRLARNLLRRIELKDGAHVLTADPQLVHPGMVGEFLDRLNDPSRRGAVFALGTSDRILPQEFSDKLPRWFRDTTGMAQAIVLTPDATVEFARRSGSFFVPEASIRTFGPGLDTRAQATSRFHRIMRTETLASASDHKTRTLLGLFARTQVEERTIPPTVLRWERTFERLLNQSISDRLTGQQRQVPSGPTVQQGTDELERVRRTLAIPDLRDETLLELLEAATQPAVDPEALAEQSDRIGELQAQLEDLQDELMNAKSMLSDMTDEAREASDRASEAEDRHRRLARLMRERGFDPWQAEIEGADLAPESPPAAISWADLDERREQWVAFGVHITADPRTIQSMDDLDLDGRALTAAQEALRALAGYVRARRCGDHDSDFGAYLAAQIRGYPVYPSSRFAFTETGWTKTHHGDERKLPVPQWVDETEMAPMHPHMKLTKLANKDPRIHFIDAVDTNKSSVVIVGHIGPHLTNRASARLN